MNITLVVETGDHHVSVLDGDTFEVLDRFETPFAVHGGPKFTPDGRYVFIMSRDGWVQKYDIWAAAGGAGSRRPQQPQHRDQPGWQTPRRGQLPANDIDASVDR